MMVGEVDISVKTEDILNLPVWKVRLLLSMIDPSLEVCAALQRKANQDWCQIEAMALKRVIESAMLAQAMCEIVLKGAKESDKLFEAIGRARKALPADNHAAAHSELESWAPPEWIAIDDQRIREREED